MSGINSIYNVQSSLPRGYQSNIKNKTLIERMQSEHPGMIEGVAKKIDSTLDNALMAIRVEGRFSKEKQTLKQMETKWVGGGYKANFAANLEKASGTYERVVSAKMDQKLKATDRKMEQIIKTDSKGNQTMDLAKAQAYLAAEHRHLYTTLKMPLMPNESHNKQKVTVK